MRKLIYYVEDEPSINELIGETLRSKDFEAIGFLEPKSFLKKIQIVKPDLIVLDLMLPYISGFEIIRTLKQKPEYENIPIIILSARSLETDIVKGLDMGASDYITKPFGLKEFISRVNVNLRRINMHEGKTFKVKDLTLYTDKHEFYCGDTLIDLRAKEFDILALLMETPSIVVTRTTLFRKVWGIDYEIETRTLDMHIKTIREKLAQVSNEQYIETIRGVGYIIRD